MYFNSETSPVFSVQCSFSVYSQESMHRTTTIISAESFEHDFPFKISAKQTPKEHSPENICLATSHRWGGKHQFQLPLIMTPSEEKGKVKKISSITEYQFISPNICVFCLIGF